MNTFINFLKTGEFGILEIGKTRQCIEEYLGEPEGVSHNKSFMILKYGSIQLTFCKVRNNELEQHILKHINIEFDEGLRFPNTLKIEGWYPSSKMNYSEFIKIAKEYDIRLIKDKQHTFGNIQLGLKTECGVIIIFDDENVEKEIVSMGLFRV